MGIKISRLCPLYKQQLFTLDTIGPGERNEYNSILILILSVSDSISCHDNYHKSPNTLFVFLHF